MVAAIYTLAAPQNISWIANILEKEILLLAHFNSKYQAHPNSEVFTSLGVTRMPWVYKMLNCTFQDSSFLDIQCIGQEAGGKNAMTDPGYKTMCLVMKQYAITLLVS